MKTEHKNSVPNPFNEDELLERLFRTFYEMRRDERLGKFQKKFIFSDFASKYKMP